METIFLDVVLGVLLMISLLLFVFVSFGLMFLFGSPWVPTRMHEARAMLELAGVKPGEVVTDLGSGDGRLLILAVKEFGAARGVGHEIHPGLIAYARLRAMAAGVSKQISFARGNFLTTSVRKTDVVVLYLLGPLMEKLMPKLVRELDPETRIVSNGFRFPGVEPYKSIDLGDTHVFLYRVKDLIG